MTTHEQVAQDLPLYALGTLTDDDRRCVEEHLQECARCRFELHLLREDMNRLALSGPELPIIEDLHPRELPPMITLDQVEPASRAPRIYWFAALPVILCIVLGAMVVQLRTRNMELESQYSATQQDIARERTVSEHARLIDSIVHDSASAHFATSGADGNIQVLFNGNVHRALAVVSHLPRPNSPQVYQLWLIPTEGHPVSAGTFVPDAQGNAFVLSPQLAHDIQIAGFQVTIETQGGAPAPSGLPVYSGK